MAHSLEDSLGALFDAETRARALHADLVRTPHSELVTALSSAARAALELAEGPEADVRLSRLALLFGDLDGAEAVDRLIDILGSSSAEGRGVAGEVLEALAFDRFKEVALGIERALERLPNGSPALTELPYLLAEVGEPGCVKLLGRFFKHADAEAVAAAIEAAAELGDPTAAPLLASLERDGRQVEIEDDGERVALGDLAHEAKELLEGIARELAVEHGHATAGKGSKKGR